MHKQAQRSHFKNLDQFPGWSKAPGFLQSIIVQHKFKKIADVGGGRSPRLPLDFIAARKLNYTVYDISQSELDLADAAYQKLCMDVTSDDSVLTALGIARDHDLVFSHMLLEHLPDPLRAHATFYRMLRPGGLSIHMFSSRNNFPLFVNGMMPTKISDKLKKVLQPHRNPQERTIRSETFYKYCGAPSADMSRIYETLGFEVVEHLGFVGHEYYKRIPPLALAERGLRRVILKAGIPMISANLLMLRKRTAH